MKLQDLPTHARPVEISNQGRWIGQLRERSNTLSPQAGGAESPGIRTLVAVRPDQLDAASELVRRRYAWRGYQVAVDEAEFPFSEETAPMTLLAEDGTGLLGTLTVRPSAPLLAEKTYAADIERLRAAGHRLGEVVKLAVETGVDWKGALDALVQSAYFVSHVLHGLTDVIIEVNPRHVRFYDKVLGFTTVASGGICSRVAAPSVLMRLDLAAFGKRVRASLAA
jgi:hypothetical protein